MALQIANRVEYIKDGPGDINSATCSFQHKIFPHLYQSMFTSQISTILGGSVMFGEAVEM